MRELVIQSVLNGNGETQAIQELKVQGKYPHPNLSIGSSISSSINSLITSMNSVNTAEHIITQETNVLSEK